ncbi:MAG: Bax inhibitor-1/YccA family protein [Lachnospiraceae bacterium]|nr:Bax inhibitor-1/YccA family protein [Lachnospiraceae bacterium]
MAYTNVQPQRRGFFSNLANPVLRKMEKNADYSSEETASYKGIVSKTVFFLVVTVIGAFLCFIVHNLLIASTSADQIIHAADAKNGIYNFSIAPAEAIIMIVVLAISLIVPFLAWFIRASVPVTGTIYCVAQGYLIGFITVALAQEYKFISFLAMIITLALVAAMLFVYAKRIIKVTARFRGIITAIFIGIVLSGIFFFILSIIPGIRNSMAYQGVASVMNNPAFSIILSIVFVIIAALFMLVDFDTIERCVENKMDKKYEWMAAWGLAYTILYIYFKVLRILLMIFGRGKSSRD